MDRLAGAAPLAAALALALAGCKVEPGSEGVSAEMNRLRGQNGFAVVSAHPARAVFAAQGRDVVVEPAGGFCVERDALDVSGTAAFALLSDCQPAGARPFPGIITVSVSSTGMMEPGTTPTEALRAMREFLATDQGLALLGRSGGPVSVEAAHDVGDGLYVLVEDGTSGPLPVLSPRFWRAFLELNGRMAMVTVSSFRENPLGDQAMLGSLARQVVALRRANRSAASPEELALAKLAEEIAETTRATEQIEIAGSGDFPDEEEEAPTASQAVEALPRQAGAYVPAVVTSVPAQAPRAADEPAAGGAPAAPAGAGIVRPDPARNPPYQGPASQG